MVHALSRLMADAHAERAVFAFYVGLTAAVFIFLAQLVVT
jgi:hypothetical protein